jgi:hypothetical protein
MLELAKNIIEQHDDFGRMIDEMIQMRNAVDDGKLLVVRL